jgi:hypothetical protein
MDTGRNQNPEASGQSTRLPAKNNNRLCWSFGTTLVHAAVMVLMLAHFAEAQKSFDVSNPKQQKWPEAEAERIYLSTARDLAAEFKLAQIPRARFTLVLGADENSVDMNASELRLKRWDRYLYAEGVLRLSFDQMLSWEAKMRLARRAVAESVATVNGDEARTSHVSPEPWYEEPPPAHGWASRRPR